MRIKLVSVRLTGLGSHTLLTSEQRYEHFKSQTKCLNIILNSEETFTAKKIDKLTNDDIINYKNKIEEKINKKEILSSVEKFNFILCRFLYLFPVCTPTRNYLFSAFLEWIETQENQNIIPNFSLLDSCLTKIEKESKNLKEIFKSFQHFNEELYEYFFLFLDDPINFLDNSENQLDASKKFPKKKMKPLISSNERYEYFKSDEKCLEQILNSNETFKASNFKNFNKQDLYHIINYMESKIKQKQKLTAVEKFNFIFCKYLYIFNKIDHNNFIDIYYKKFIATIKEIEENEQFVDFGLYDFILINVSQEEYNKPMLSPISLFYHFLEHPLLFV
jgi:glycerol-3-phosphate cytidylyltransferase-like family protein